jgi:hypothetical protein
VFSIVHERKQSTPRLDQARGSRARREWRSEGHPRRAVRHVFALDPWIQEQLLVGRRRHVGDGFELLRQIREILGRLTSSACLPPSYRTMSTLTFSRGKPVSDRIDMVGPSLLRHNEPGSADEFAADCRDVTPPVREEELLRLETAEAEARELRPLLREAMGPSERARGRDAEASTILAACKAQLI